MTNVERRQNKKNVWSDLMEYSFEKQKINVPPQKVYKTRKKTWKQRIKSSATIGGEPWSL